MEHQRLKDALARTTFSKPFRPTVADCILWTEILNHVLFGDNLFIYHEVRVRRLRGAYAYFIGTVEDDGSKTAVLEVNAKFKDFTMFYWVLLHELIHAIEFQERGGFSHGKFFHSYRKTAALLGIPLRRIYQA